MSKKFQDKQDYAEETEGSNLDDTACEYSSEEDNSNKNKKMNKDLLVKRKRVLSKKSDIDEPPKKSQKTVYMESFDLTPCDTPEKLSNETAKELCVITDKVTDKIAIEVISKLGDDQITSETNNINKVAEQIPKIIIENKTLIENNSNSNLENKNVVQTGSFSDSDGTLVIDEDICVGDNTEEKHVKNSKRIEDEELGKENNINITIPIDTEISNKTIIEPENKEKDVIEINELDDSDVEITSVPLQNKQSLESIIKNSMFELSNYLNYVYYLK